MNRTIPFSVVIASCLNKPERENYLIKTVEAIRKAFPKVEILIAFDKKGKTIPGCRCYTHNKGLGHSFNWGMKNASNDLILQMEDDWIVREELVNNIQTWLKIVSTQGGHLRLTHPIPREWIPGKTEKKIDDTVYYELNKPRIPEHWKYIDVNNWNIYYYCNHPHVKNRKIHDRIGYYAEGVSVPEVEIDMCIKYLKGNEPTFLSTNWEVTHIGNVSSQH
jgi:glycosyltransferase involved in cell wall biosynthesis